MEVEGLVEELGLKLGLDDGDADDDGDRDGEGDGPASLKCVVIIDHERLPNPTRVALDFIDLADAS